MHTNNNQPTISMVIPVYNEEKYIEQCLKSLINQTRQANEIIIVNNNCTDKTISIAKKYPVKIVNEERQGIIFARNKGFNNAVSEIIARTDADAILPKNWIEIIHKQFKNPKISALSGGFTFYDFFSKSQLFSKLYGQILRNILKGHNIFIGPNMILRKKLWEKVKNNVCLDDKIVHEDIDISIHIAQLNELIILDPQLTTQISSRRIKKNPSSFFIEYFFRTIKTIRNHPGL